jgi:hypothetical protein
MRVPVCLYQRPTNGNHVKIWQLVLEIIIIRAGVTTVPAGDGDLAKFAESNYASVQPTTRTRSLTLVATCETIAICSQIQKPYNNTDRIKGPGTPAPIRDELDRALLESSGNLTRGIPIYRDLGDYDRRWFGNTVFKIRPGQSRMQS